MVILIRHCKPVYERFKRTDIKNNEVLNVKKMTSKENDQYKLATKNANITKVYKVYKSEKHVRSTFIKFSLLLIG